MCAGPMYSVPGVEEDFIPQNVPPRTPKLRSHNEQYLYRTARIADTGPIAPRCRGIALTRGGQH